MCVTCIGESAPSSLQSSHFLPSLFCRSLHAVTSSVCRMSNVRKIKQIDLREREWEQQQDIARIEVRKALGEGGEELFAEK